MTDKVAYRLLSGAGAKGSSCHQLSDRSGHVTVKTPSNSPRNVNLQKRGAIQFVTQQLSPDFARFAIHVLFPSAYQFLERFPSIDSFISCITRNLHDHNMTDGWSHEVQHIQLGRITSKLPVYPIWRLVGD